MRWLVQHVLGDRLGSRQMDPTLSFRCDQLCYAGDVPGLWVELQWSLRPIPDRWLRLARRLAHGAAHGQGEILGGGDGGL